MGLGYSSVCAQFFVAFQLQIPPVFLLCEMVLKPLKHFFLTAGTLLLENPEIHYRKKTFLLPGSGVLAQQASGDIPFPGTRFLQDTVARSTQQPAAFCGTPFRWFCSKRPPVRHLHVKFSLTLQRVDLEHLLAEWHHDSFSVVQ